MYAQHSNQAELSHLATEIRILLLQMLAHAQSGHTAGALGMVEVFVSLYFSLAKIDPNQPRDEDRDYILLSAGHICPVLYSTLAKRGFFPMDELKTLRTLNSRLQGHPHLHSLPGVENTSGPLGQGLSQAIGIALSLKLDKKSNRVICILSDGEQQEGQTWEAYLYAGAHQLDNLTIFIDRNHIQIGGSTDAVLPLGDLAQKLKPMGWHTHTIDGHSFDEIRQAYETSVSVSGPTAIICNTTPGKGVSFMENDYTWHGKPPSTTELEKAIQELSNHE